ncbi:amidohydrolase family protein [Arachidicoccus sp.]|uniref:amidohydrolase family protein n=1 Tax=Arachidicoccus sp. TaxID=1872624 RepID=UPI003D1C243F
MILRKLHMVNEEAKRNIKIEGKKIKNIAFEEILSNKHEIDLSFDNCYVFPGLINSHDHLDFDLFPQLGNHIYKNYLEWGIDIHRQNDATIRQILSIPKALRVKWGVYKNLVTGITTAVQHGEELEITEKSINVFQDCISLHSVSLEKHWRRTLNNPFSNRRPFVVHVGEGTDTQRCEEIDELLHYNFFRRKLVGVHGIAMNVQQAKKFQALIWCPDSNYFLYGNTARINELRNYTKILFGTDSTVSADWNIWNHFRLARMTNLLDDDELFRAVTTDAAKIWKLNKTGSICEGYYADLFIAKMHSIDKNDANNFFSTNPENIQLVLHKGAIVLFDASLLTQLKNVSLKDFSCIYVKGNQKFVLGDLPSLIKEIQKYVPEIKFPIDVE